jgi:hypothetical protein
MKVDLNRVLSSEVIKIFEDGGFNIEAIQIYPDSILSGPIYFLVSSKNLPLVHSPYSGLCGEGKLEPFDILECGNVNGSIDLTVEVTYLNRNKSNFDDLIVPKFIKNIDNLDISNITMKFTDEKGHGLYGLPDDMRERYNFIEGIVLKLKDVQNSLIQNRMKNII